jgi:hypothetical protein
MLDMRKDGKAPVERKWKDLNDFKQHTKSKQHKNARETKATEASM